MAEVTNDISRVEVELEGARSVVLGGLFLENRPATLVRALLRSGNTDLFLSSSPAASWDADVLVAAGRVSTLRIPHVSLGRLGLAPGLRSQHANGALSIEYTDEAMQIGSLVAAANRTEFQVLSRLGENDLTRNSDVLRQRGSLRGVEPLHSDVALIHAQYSDENGNLVQLGSRYADTLLARTASTVIAQVDKIIPGPLARHIGISVPGYLIDIVVEAPFAAHPCGSYGSYLADWQHLSEYKSMITAGKTADYLKWTCAQSPDEYYRSVVGADHGSDLSAKAVL
jgi:glutaconate CoA-transferase, subunit A